VFDFLYDPCPFKKLALKPNPFRNVTYFFGESAVTQTFEVSDLVSMDTKDDCGPLAVEFVNQADGKPLPPRWFSLTLSSLTVNK